MKRLSIALLASIALSSAAFAAGSRAFSIAGQAFSESDILDARGQPSLEGGATIRITLAPDAAKRLAALSRDNRGQPVKIELDGRVLAEPVVQGEIADGVAEIAGKFTLPEADALALKIAGKPPLSDSLEDQ